MSQAFVCSLLLFSLTTFADEPDDFWGRSHWRALSNAQEILPNVKSFMTAMLQLKAAEDLRNERLQLEETLASGESSATTEERIAKIKREEYALVFVGREGAQAKAAEIQLEIEKTKLNIKNAGDDKASVAILEGQLAELEEEQRENAESLKGRSTRKSAFELLEEMPGLFGEEMATWKSARESALRHFEKIKPNFGERVAAKLFKRNTALSGESYFGRFVTAQFKAGPEGAKGASKLGEYLLSPNTLVDDTLERVRRSPASDKVKAQGLRQKVSGH